VSVSVGVETDEVAKKEQIFGIHRVQTYWMDEWKLG